MLQFSKQASKQSLSQALDISFAFEICAPQLPRHILHNFDCVIVCISSSIASKLDSAQLIVETLCDLRKYKYTYAQIHKYKVINDTQIQSYKCPSIACKLDEAQLIVTFCNSSCWGLEDSKSTAVANFWKGKITSDFGAYRVRVLRCYWQYLKTHLGKIRSPLLIFSQFLMAQRVTIH